MAASIQPQTPTQSATSQDCAAELMEAVPLIMQFVRTEMRSQREASLSVPQFRVLAFLRRHPGSSLSEVAEHLGVTAATASAMVDRLVQLGYVDRAESPQERRRLMLKLTPTGTTQIEAMVEMTRNKVAGLLEMLPPEQLVAVKQGLTALRQVFTAIEPAEE